MLAPNRLQVCSQAWQTGLVPTINDVSTFPIGSISRLISGKRLRFADVG